MNWRLDNKKHEKAFERDKTRLEEISNENVENWGTFDKVSRDNKRL
jgi:hypothetical protein